MDRWRELLPQTDLLIITLPLTPATRHLVGAAEVDLLRTGAWIINVSRGGVVDEAALIARLQAGRLGAALDVFAEEPLPADSPFWTLPNVIVTPHNAGHSELAWVRGVELFGANLARYRAGERLFNTVDLEAGY